MYCPFCGHEETKVNELLVKVFREQAPGAKWKQQLYEYATCHDEPQLAEWLQDGQGPTPARHTPSPRPGAANKLKVLGITSPQRSALQPAWPTIAETLPGYEAVNWAGMCAPAGLPRELAQRLAEDLQAVLKAPDMAKLLADQGIDTGVQGPEEFAGFIASEVKRFEALTKPLAPRMN